MLFRKMLAAALVLSLTLCGCFAPRRDKNTYEFWNSDSQITTIEILKKTEDTGRADDPTEQTTRQKWFLFCRSRNTMLFWRS